MGDAVSIVCGCTTHSRNVFLGRAQAGRALRALRVLRTLKALRALGPIASAGALCFTIFNSLCLAYNQIMSILAVRVPL